jgi:hypothetical protein
MEENFIEVLYDRLQQIEEVHVTDVKLHQSLILRLYELGNKSPIAYKTLLVFIFIVFLLLLYVETVFIIVCFYILLLTLFLLLS